MKRYSDKIKVLCLSLAVIFCAGLYCFAHTPSESSQMSRQAAEPSGALRAAQNASPAALSAQTTAAAQTGARGRDDGLMDDVSFSTGGAQEEEEETSAVIQMGKDFAVDGIKPAGGQVYELLPGDSVTNSLFSERDCRAYSLSVEQRGVIQLHFSFNVSEVAGTPWIIYLYQAYSSDGAGDADAYRRLSTLKVTSSATDAKCDGEKIGVYPGEYLIFVCAGDVCSVDQFTLRADVTYHVAWEAEPNDSITRYTELPFGIRTGGSCSEKNGGDTDWYMIELPQRGVIDLSFEHADDQLPQVGWYVTLQNEQGELLYHARSFFKDAKLESGEIGLNAGVYYIKITPHIHNDIDYYLTCTYEKIATYETEMNDAPETADVIFLTADGDQCGVSGAISDRTTLPDKDYYRFEPDRDGVISFSFVHQDYLRNRDGWDVSLIDANGRVLYHMISKWNDMVVTSPQIGLEKGVYYLLVDGEDMLLNSGTYIIGINYAPGDNWESENNDTPETADRIALNQTLYGSLITMDMEYDTDVFTFELTRSTPVQLVFSHNGLAQNYEGWVISLCGKDGKKITGFSSMWSDTETASELMNLAPGTYYLKVETGARFTDLKYSVEVRA